MCGIRLTVTAAVVDAASDDPNDGVKNNASLVIPEWLARRGPDHQDSAAMSANNHHHHHHPTTTKTTKMMISATLQASVLQMREQLVPQPVAIVLNNNETDDDDAKEDQPSSSISNSSSRRRMHLAWNGEVYQRTRRRRSCTEEHDEDDELENVGSHDESDTLLVARALQAAITEKLQQQQSRCCVDDNNKNDVVDDVILEAVQTVMSSLVNAEFAFCLLTDDAVYYGRDGLGRRSLLVWEPANENDEDEHHHQQQQQQQQSRRRRVWELASVASKLPDNHHQDQRGDEFIGAGRWTEVEPGRVFCYRCGESAAAAAKQGQRTRRIASVSLLPYHTTSTASAFLLSSHHRPQPPPPDSLEAASRQLQDLLLEAVRRRIVVVPPLASSSSSSSSLGSSGNIKVNDNANKNHQQHHSPPCSILFSGGLDSAVLAALVLTLVPPDHSVWLVNVSFVDQHDEVVKEEDDAAATTTTTAAATRKNSTNSNDKSPTVLSADTRAARASFDELQQLFPNHFNLHLVERQADWKEIVAVEPTVQQLLHPKPSTSVMDLNIATALWFAAQAAAGAASSSTDAVVDSHNATTSSSISSSRILLTGLGADELLGGYGRHRQAWLSGGATALRHELDLDLQRLWQRNLGRDDRILSHHAQEARYPYLDCHVKSFLQRAVPVEYLSDFTRPPGVGDKRLLRLVAANLGLVTASGAVKRAIQFGSRISHVSDKKRFGSRRKATHNNPKGKKHQQTTTTT